MAKGSGGVAARVEALVRPTIEGLGLRLWDVRYEKEGPDYYLRVLIDRDEPMDTDTCALASHAIDPILDEHDPVPDSYYLEVGSPGLGRRLTRPEHFQQVLGEKIFVSRFAKDENGDKEISGILTAADKESLTLDTEKGTLTVALKDTGMCKLCDDEDLFG